MIIYERQKDGTLKQVDSPPKRAELIEQRIYDRCIVRVGQLEAEKVTLEARIDELCAEVERLKGEFKKMDVWHSQELKAAMVENDKLRELMSVMAYCNQFRRDCDGCSMNGAAGIITERAGCDELLDRMRELGVTA